MRRREKRMGEKKGEENLELTEFIELKEKKKRILKRKISVEGGRLPGKTLPPFKKYPKGKELIV